MLKQLVLLVLASVVPARCASADSFTLTGSMKVARAGHRATLLSDGRVLVTGGFDAGSRALTAAEIFDPRSGTWASAASSRMPRGDHAAIQLADGRVLIAGGAFSSGGCAPNATAEVYDPAKDAWSLTGDLPFVAGRGVKATTIDGQLLLYGGDGCGGAAPTVAMFDPAKSQWSTLTSAVSIAPPALSTRAGAAVTPLRQSVFLVTGGTLESEQIMASAERVDAQARTFTLEGSLVTPRTCHSATRLSNGTVLVAGGTTPSGPTATAEIYLPEIAYQSSPFAAPRKYGLALAAASNSRGHVFVLHPGQGPARDLVEYAPAEGPVPDMWVPVKAIGVEMIGMPHSVRVDAQDNVWVVVYAGKPGGVIKLDANGHAAMVIAPANRTRLWQPADVAWDGAGNIFVLDAWEGGVRKFDPVGHLLATTINTGDDALKNPHSIATDASGNIYVSDGAKARIQVFDNALTFKASYDTVGSAWALCISPGPHQYLYSGESRDRDEFAPPGDGTILKLELDGTIVGRIGRPDNPQGVFRTPHHIGCSRPNELLSFSNRDWGGTIRLQP